MDDIHILSESVISLMLDIMAAEVYQLNVVGIERNECIIHVVLCQLPDMMPDDVVFLIYRLSAVCAYDLTIVIRPLMYEPLPESTPVL